MRYVRVDPSASVFNPDFNPEPAQKQDKPRQGKFSQHDFSRAGRALASG